MDAEQSESEKRQPMEQIALRLPPEVLAKLRATGRGWQTRLSEIISATAERWPDSLASPSLWRRQLERIVGAPPTDFERQVDDVGRAYNQWQRGSRSNLAELPDWPAAMTLDEAEAYSRIRTSELRKHLRSLPLGANGSHIVSRLAVDQLVERLLSSPFSASDDMDFDEA